MQTSLPSSFLLKAALLCGVLSCLGLADSRAVLIDLWLNSSQTTGSPAGQNPKFENYYYNTETGQLSTVRETVNPPTGIRASGAVERSGLTLSGDGKYLVWMGYYLSGPAGAIFTTYNLQTKQFDTSTLVVAPTTYRNIWSPGDVDGNQYGFYAVGSSDQGSPSFSAYGSTTYSQLGSDLSFQSVNSFNDYVMISRNAGDGTRGVYRKTAPGLPTSGGFTRLTGTGWNTTGGDYGAFSMLGSQWLFVTDALTDTIQVFFNESLDFPTSGWNLYTSVSTIVGSVGANPWQLSLMDLGDGNAQLFYTSGNAFGTVSWAWDEFSQSFGFGAVNILAAPGSGRQFQGVAVLGVVPEPGTVFLLGLGLGVVLFSRRARRAVAMRFSSRPVA